MVRSAASCLLHFCLFLLPLPFVSCGYHIAGNSTSATIPKNVKTIAVPAFSNLTIRYKLTSYLPAAITREFISRTRYQVVNDPKEADAVLSGELLMTPAQFLVKKTDERSHGTCVDEIAAMPMALLSC